MSWITAAAAGVQGHGSCGNAAVFRDSSSLLAASNLLQYPFPPLGGRSMLPRGHTALQVDQQRKDGPFHRRAQRPSNPKQRTTIMIVLNWKAVGMGFSLLGQLLINERLGKKGII
jgi:hypothetical protein